MKHHRVHVRCKIVLGHGKQWSLMATGVDDLLSRDGACRLAKNILSQPRVGNA